MSQTLNKVKSDQILLIEIDLSVQVQHVNLNLIVKASLMYNTMSLPKESRITVRRTHGVFTFTFFLSTDDGVMAKLKDKAGTECPTMAEPKYCKSD